MTPTAGSNSSCNSPVAPTGLPGPCRATAATGLTISRRPVALTTLPGHSRVHHCDRSFAGTPPPFAIAAEIHPAPGSPANFRCPAHHLPPAVTADFSGRLPGDHLSHTLSHPLGRLLRLPAIHRERRCAKEGPAEGASVPDGTKKGPSETPGGLPCLPDGCWCSR